MERKGGKWELPKIPPLIWNASEFERAARCPQHEKKKFRRGQATSFFL